MNIPFHLSLPCNDLEATKKFYVEDLEMTEGRSSSNWLDINLFQHQITFVLSDKHWMNSPSYKLDSGVLPMFHFGVILEFKDWKELYKKASSRFDNLIPKKTFLKDKLGEHHSFFIKDPNGYTIEFKTFEEKDSIFSH